MHIALDLALGRTGVAWADGSDVFACPKKLTGGERLRWWCLELAGILVPHNPATLIVEAPFLHPGHPSGSIPLIELHGVVRCFAADYHLEYVTVPPTTLKKWATGSGKATKDDMIAAANTRRDYPIGDHNEADAVLLWHWGQQ